MEKRLSQLIAENKVIPFVGAGVSKDVKYKDKSNVFYNWKELLEILIKNIEDEDIKMGVSSFLKSGKYDYLKIADMIEDELSANDFNKYLKEIFNVDYNEIDESTYSLATAIWNLNTNLIITTNYDKVLHNACSDRNITSWDIESIHEQGSSLRDGVLNPTVWHLHGFEDNINNIILTSKKYNEFYTTKVEDSKYKAALETLRNTISSKSILFIGFSLDDEFVINQINRTVEIFDSNTHEHYVCVKKGTVFNNLNKNIKVIEYENHGKPLIDLLDLLKKPHIKSKNTSLYKTHNLTRLPPINPNFIGREDELEEIEKQLKDNGLIYVVNGIGGVGKSELSYKYLHKNKDKYNNIAFIEMTQDSLIEEVFLTKFKDELQLDEHSTLDTVIQRLQRKPKKNLLLIDNIENEEDFKKIKPLNTNFDLLITTRINIDTKNKLNLNTLNDQDAKELFYSIYLVDENISDILKYLDNHPLFINLISKSLNLGYLTISELRKNIKNNTISKIDSTNDKTFEEHLQDTFNKQFKKENSTDLIKLLQYISIFPSVEIDFSTIEKCINIDKLKVKLSKLVERGWLIEKNSSYKLHKIIKTFILGKNLIKYEDIIFICNNISNYIDPYDSSLIANKLTHYLPIIESILTLFEKNEDNNIASLLDSITYIFYAQAQYESALEHQNRALKIRQCNFGESSEVSAKSYNLLGTIYAMKIVPEKEKYFQVKALEIRKKELGEKHFLTGFSYNNVALYYLRHGCSSEQKLALEYHEKAFSNILEYFGENNIYTASCYIMMAQYDSENISMNMTKLELLNKSLKIRVKILGEDHTLVAENYSTIATYYFEKQDYKNALIFSEKVLKIRISVLGENHPATAEAYNNIATSYNDGKINTNKVIYYYNKALDIYEKIFEDLDPNLYTIYKNLGFCYAEKTNCNNAKKYLTKCILIIEKFGYMKNELFKMNNALKKQKKNIKREANSGFKNKGRFCKDT